jgi:hypothetical protein
MNNNYYQSPKASKLMRMFWKAAGADQYLLERSTYSDQIKYFCLGGIVIATGVMAAMAGGYAIYTIFEPKGNALDGMLTDKAVQAGAKAKDLIHLPTLFISVVFGLIWGLIIYNIDRFIVTSTGKGDGTEAITGQEFKSAIPRIVMGLIIALTISKPIEIRMFKGEIDAKLSELQDVEYSKRKVVIDQNIESEIVKEKEKINEIEKQRKEISDKVNDFSQRYANETMGMAGARGYGPEAKKMEEEKNYWTKKLEQYDTINNKELIRLKGNIELVEAKRTEKYHKAELEVAAMDGLLIRLKLAHEIAGWVISLFITLLFVVIELTPIFFKMMLIKGPYDYMDENVKELARAESGIEILYNYYEDVEGMEAHKVVNHGAELKRKERILIIQAQEELNEKIISNWKENKKIDIDQNPDKYISEK